jgi:hypothetical protein
VGRARRARGERWTLCVRQTQASEVQSGWESKDGWRLRERREGHVFPTSRSRLLSSHVRTVSDAAAVVGWDAAQATDAVLSVRAARDAAGARDTVLHGRRHAASAPASMPAPVTRACAALSAGATPAPSPPSAAFPSPVSWDSSPW